MGNLHSFLSNKQKPSIMEVAWIPVYKATTKQNW